VSKIVTLSAALDKQAQKRREDEKAAEERRVEAATAPEPIAESKQPPPERSAHERSERTIPNVQPERSLREHPLAERSPIERFTFKAGFTAIPNTVLESVLPVLEPAEQLVFLRLYRLSWGFKNPECVVSVPKLASTTKIGRTKVFGALTRLEQLGLIRRVKTGRGRAQGTVYQVERFGDDYGERSQAERSPRGHSPRERSPGEPNKESSKEIHDRAPVAVAPALDVYGIRKIVARFREAHRGETAYNREDLKRDVKAALGTDVDEALLEEAIG
jgi:hypothetical protein